MHDKRLGTQANFFDLLPGPDLTDNGGYDPRPFRDQIEPEELIRHQQRVFDKLTRVREAVELPWKDLTRATSEEMSFHSDAQVWFPETEALALRRAFNAEMKRLWGAIGEVSLYNDL